MAFQTIEKGKYVLGGKPLENTVSAHSDVSSLRVYISSDICARMNIAKKSFVTIARGVGSDAGHICLTIDHSRNQKTSYIVVKPSSGSAGTFSCSVNRIGLHKDRFGSTVIPHDLTANGLVIDLRPLMAASAVRAAR